MVYEMKLDETQIASITQTMKPNNSDFYMKFFTSCNDASSNAELLRDWQGSMQASRTRFFEEHRKKQ